MTISFPRGVTGAFDQCKFEPGKHIAFHHRWINRVKMSKALFIEKVVCLIKQAVIVQSNKIYDTKKMKKRRRNKETNVKHLETCCFALHKAICRQPIQ